MRKLLSCLLALVMLCTVMAPALAEETSFTVETLDVPLLFTMGELYQDVLPLTFINGDYTVPYISIENYYLFITEFIQAAYGTEFSVTCTDTEDGLLCMRENGSFLLFDFDERSIYISDPDMFETPVGSVCVIDETGTAGAGLRDEEGNLRYDENGNVLVNTLYRVDDGSTFISAGSPMLFSFEDTSLTIFRTEEGHFLPLAMLNNLFHAGCGIQLVFNGSYLFLLLGYDVDNTVTDANGLTLYDYYYDVPTTQRSETLTQLTYELLCYELDLKYGLKEAHGITDDFDTYFETIGLKEKLMNPDAKVFVNALNELTRTYFADFHSGLTLPGCYAGSLVYLNPISYPASSQYSSDAEAIFRTARQASGLVDRFGNILQAYQEVGNTAYLTFDSFVGYGYDLYDPDVQAVLEDLANEGDTFALVAYAAQQISRENSPIEHVVIDLSLNGGGLVKSCIYLASWLLGNANMSTMNPTTGAKYNVTFRADTNLDGIITSEDSLDLDKIDVYCLISLNSFSCGNLLPAMLKDSGRVTLLGQTSGGGSCMVGNMVTADGTMLNYSSTNRMSSVKNGSFYDIDQGVTPDFVIRKAEHYYNREWLNSFIEQLP